MSEDNSSNEPDDLPETPPKTIPLFWIEIQQGNVFSGTLNSFEELFFLFPKEMEYSDEQKVAWIEHWAYEQSWSFSCKSIH